jgi:hypothetical protein
MNFQFVRKYKVATRLKKQPFPLIAIDGKRVLYNAGMVRRETDELTLRLGRDREKLQFDSTEAPGCDVVLRSTWLKGSSPTIDWWRETTRFENEDPQQMPLSVVRNGLDTIDIHAMSISAYHTHQKANVSRCRLYLR